MHKPSVQHLIRLLDDPDEEIFLSVNREIRELGPAVIPELEKSVRRAGNKLLHERIEELIKILTFDELSSDMISWVSSPRQDLLTGITIMTRCQFHDMTAEKMACLLKPIRNEIWLELNEQLTALEKILVINRLLFRDDRFTLYQDHQESPGHNFINRLLTTYKGNEFSITLFYAWLCQDLGLPVFAVSLPNLPVLAYLDIPLMPEHSFNPALFDTLFYLVPVLEGGAFSQEQMTEYLIRNTIPIEASFYMPVGNTTLIRMCMERLADDYERSDNREQAARVRKLMKLCK